jgi:hypothetical protein
LSLTGAELGAGSDRCARAAARAFTPARAPVVLPALARILAAGFDPRD